MAHIRKFVSYRRIDRPPFTRYSKYKTKNYVGNRPVCRVTHFNHGDRNGTFDTVMTLIQIQNRQLRDTAIESARQTCNRVLEKALGKEYYLTVRAYPHHILRENPLASGAGADRMSTGMAHSYGKNIGVAARMLEGKPIMVLKLNHDKVSVGRLALKRASYKLSGNQHVVVKSLEVIKKAVVA